MPCEAGAIPPIASLARIGGGRSADVYALPSGRVLKLFRDHADPAVAEREAAAARLAAGTGVRVATPFEATTVAGRIALVSERLNGETALALLRRHPLRLPAMLRDLARYQARMHRAVVAPDALPALDFVIAARLAWAEITDTVRAAALQRLATLPRGDRLCHGDLHPANLLATPEGPAAIDWSLATRGDPAGDVARTELLLRFAAWSPRTRRWPPLRALRRLTAWWYRRCYCRATGMAARDIRAWHLPVAAAWLQPGSSADAPALRAFITRAMRG